MAPKLKKRPSQLQLSPAAAVLLLAGCFALFSLLFRYEAPRVNTTAQKTGQLRLLPVRENSDEARWLKIHDPSRIARGGELPEAMPRPEPAGSPKPEPAVLPASPRPVAPAPFARQQKPAVFLPVTTPPPAREQYPKLAVESYPRVSINGRKWSGKLPEKLLKQAAAVNAGTAILRFSAGLVEGDHRVAVTRSSGSIRIDQALIKQFAAHPWSTLPAVVRIVWDAAGEENTK